MFPGGLAPYLGVGILIGLVGNGVINIVGALRTSMPFSLVTPQDKAGVILGGIGIGFGALVIANPDTAPHLVSNFIALMCIAAIFTGLIIYLAGRFKMGRWAQILPYPVIGGFLAGSGVLMFKAAFVVLLDHELTLDALPFVFAPASMMQWVLALGVAIGLARLVRAFPTPITLPIILGAVTVLIYAGQFAAPHIVTADWFFNPAPPIGDQWQNLSPAYFDPALILSFTPELLSITLLTMLALILNVLAIGIALKQDIHLDRELQANGMANIVGGLFGVMAGHTSNSSSVMIHNIGGRSRLVGVSCGIVCLVAAGFAPQYADKVPRILPAIILFMFAVGYLYEWLWQAPRNWQLSDRIVTLAIVALIISYDLLTAIGAGLVIATVMFAFRYSRIPVRKSERRLSQTFSNTEWPPDQRALIVREGEHTAIMSLHGFLFFGSIMRLVDHMRAYPKTVSHVHFDFLDVTGADSSATLAMSRLGLIAANKNITLSQSGLSEELTPFLRIEGARIYDTLDTAIHDFEYHLVARRMLPAIPLHDGLTRLGIAPEIQDLFEPLTLKIGAQLFHRGDRSGDIYYLESGSLSVMGSNDAILRTLRPGVLVGEMARYSDFVRSATVLAQEPSKLYRLRDDHISALPENLGAGLHEAIAKLLTNRLTDMTRIMGQSGATNTQNAQTKVNRRS